MKNLKVSLSIFADGREFKFDDIVSGGLSRIDGEYNLKLTKNKYLEFSFCRNDGKEMDVERYIMNVSFPLQSISQVIIPECGRDYTEFFFPLYLWRMKFYQSIAFNGHHFMSLLDANRRPYFSFGIIGKYREAKYTCVSPGASKKNNTLIGSNILTMEIERPYEGFKWGKTKEIKEMFFTDESSPTWFHALRKYTQEQKKWLNIPDKTEPVNPLAYEPVWCTWTAYFSSLSDQKLIDNAVVAKKLGINSILIDDGWYGPGLDQESGNNMGDFYPDKTKFSDFNKTIKTIQAMGSKVILWVAPHGISPLSEKFSKYEHLFKKVGGANYLLNKSFHAMCPCNKEAREYVVNETVRLLKVHGVDGLKIDLYNSYGKENCDSTAHEHDCGSLIEGLHIMMKAIWQAMKAYKPDVILELKQNYGNVLASQYGSMVRAGDTPFDIDLDLWRCFYIQSYAAVTHNDYLAWTPYEKPENLAIMMIKLITGGVPTFSSPLPGLPKSHLEVIKSWMSFYKDYLWLLKEKREPQVGDMSVWQIKAAKAHLYSLIFTTQILEIELHKNIVIMNGTKNEEIFIKTKKAFTANVSFYNHKCVLVNKKKIKINNGTAVSIPQGGYAVLCTGK
ncbi:MAG: hypothetical protein A2252_00725 [Elusimicrobia bacterium RIFOXYA2_FULL_39_19]|nr:MAG: hypothetical protein A2252_00725 [Elusimicrobia bacterium RIFOXYA2_FULL_39_19]